MRDLKKLFLFCFVTFLTTSYSQAQVEFLEQNWNEEVRQAFYTTSQGSRMMPYDWFIALEVSDSQESFANVRLLELGYLPNENTDNNPDKLPVGFVLDENDLTKEKFIGLTCAACHTNQIEFNDKTYQIDGGPTLADMFGMISGIDESLKATRDNDAKFNRFASKVLGSENNEANQRNLKIELNKFLLYWSQFVEDSRTNHPWGRARLDAFGMIFNRVSSIDLGIPDNSQKPDAPVSYPFLWGTSFQDKVQWNGTAPNINDIDRLGRNVGGVLGVFAQAQFRATKLFQIPRPPRTSAKRLNLVKLENHLKTLWSPKWPEHLGKLDAEKVAAGKQLYNQNCVSCHEVVPHGMQHTRVEVTMTPLSEFLTDPKMAANAAFGKSETGHLKNLFSGRELVPRGEMLQRLVRLAVLSLYRDVSSSDSLIDVDSDDVFSTDEIQIFLREVELGQDEALALVEETQDKLKGYYKDLRKLTKKLKSKSAPTLEAASAPPTWKYKAAPLAGIWATAPYLHNGSVPNLYELLLPSDEGTTNFHVGSKVFDPKHVGARRR